MELKSELCKKLASYNINNKYYVTDILRAEKYIEGNNICYAYSPRKERIVLIHKKGIHTHAFIYLSNYSSGVKVECSCNSNKCEHILGSLLYLKNNIKEINELASEDDVLINYQKESIARQIECIKRLVGPHYIIIPDYESEIYLCIDKTITNLSFKEASINDVFILLDLLIKIEKERDQLSRDTQVIKNGIYNVLLHIVKMKNDSGEIEESFEKLINEHGVNVITNIITKNNIVINEKTILIIKLLLNVCSDNSLTNCYIKCLKHLGLFEEFYEYSFSHINDEEIKEVLYEELEKNKRYDDIIKHYNINDSEKITLIYLDAKSSITKEEAYNILKNNNSTKVFDKILSMNKNIDKEKVREITKNHSIDYTIHVFISYNEYDKLCSFINGLGLSKLLEYKKILFNNCREYFINEVNRKLIILFGENPKEFLKSIKILCECPLYVYYCHDILLYCLQRCDHDEEMHRKMMRLISELNL